MIGWSGVFLEAVMKKMGFAPPWIKLIMMSTTNFEVLVNGVPMRRIVPTRGIRQGNPLSPYLFFICVEALSSLLTKADRDEVLTRVPTSKRGPRINHLFFANDCLLFCRANLEHWEKLSNILKIYETTSGQKLNALKMAIYFS